MAASPVMKYRRRSRLLDTRMSMLGLFVRWKARRLSYTPLLMKSVRTLFSFEAHRKRSTGSPICLAIQPARMLPKLPVGTQKFMGSPGSMSPALTKSQ